MVYPATHLYLTFHWTTAGDEEGQTGLRVAEGSMPIAAALDQVWAVTKTFWASTGAKISTQDVLFQMKAALIDPTGHYPPGHVPELRSTGPTAGTGGVRIFPLQTACVATLEGAAPRAQAGRGRIYLPAFNSALDSVPAQWTTVATATRRTAVAQWIRDINAALAGDVSVMSSKGAGAVQAVTAVRQGTRPDVQRRRARQQPESYTTEAI